MEILTKSFVRSDRASEPAFWVLLLIAVPWALWSAFILMTIGKSDFVLFDLSAGWFVLLGLTYLCVHGLRGASWSSAPALLTITAILRFAIIPAIRFASGLDMLDSGHVQAMNLALLGFVGFWMGSLMCMKRTRLRLAPQSFFTPRRVRFVCTALLILGVFGNLALWKMGLDSYTADPAVRNASIVFLPWLNFIANLLSVALIASTIEVVGKRSQDNGIRLVYWLSLIFSIGLGVVSGMKGAILLPLLYVAIVYSIARGRIPKQMLIVPAVLLFLVYPFIGAYRNNLNNGYREQVNTATGLGAVLTKSVSDALLTPKVSYIWGKGGTLDQVTDRLSYLADLRDVCTLPDPAVINGIETVWLAPVYPLVPRFLWKNKPLFNKGQRLAIALRAGRDTSLAVTPIGDLFSLYGTFGIFVGMFVWGICLQLYMNRIAGSGMSELRLFIVISMLALLINFEDDFIVLIGGVIQIAIEMFIMAYVIYGRSSALRPHRRKVLRWVIRDVRPSVSQYES